MLVSLSGAGPLFQQVYGALRGAILRGELARGTRLPSTRGLADDLGVSRTTVLQAYRQLLAEGYATGRAGSGTFVAEELPEKAFRATAAHTAFGGPAPAARLSSYARRMGQIEVIPKRPRAAVDVDFIYGSPAVEEFPHEIWRRLLARRARNASKPSLLYGPAEGEPLLREAVADYIVRSRGVRCTPDQVVVVNGSQQALDLAARVLLDPGDHVLIENPHYQGARKVFEAEGAKLVPATPDCDGIDPATFPRAAGKARLAYVTPSHQFPSGVTMSLCRRLALLDWATDQNAFVFEDDYDSEYRYEGRPIEAMQGLDTSGRVIYAGTFSKVLFPALRMGYLVLPEALVAPFVAAKWLNDRHAPTLEQRALADFIVEGHFERHLRRSRTRNASRRATLLEAFERHLPDRFEIHGAKAGMHVIAWLRAPAAGGLDALVLRAREAGVGIYPITPYYLGKPPRDGLLVGYTSLREHEIEEGIRRLASVL